MSVEPEIKAMGDCYQIFNELNDESKTRVVQWLISKFNLLPAQKSNGIGGPISDELLGKLNGKLTVKGKSGQEVDILEFDTVADIFSKSNPGTDSEKVLVVGAFLQLKNDLVDLVSYDIQKELKHLGHEVSNITRSISLLEERKPKLMIQTRKEGKTKQAKKRYKVTVEGINSVKEMLKNIENDSE